MGMNYYLKKKDNSEFTLPKSEIGRIFENAIVHKDSKDVIQLSIKDVTTKVDKLHIGKSSFGWHFLLCIYPALGIISFDDWRALFNNEEYEIIDEEDRTVSSEDMLKTINERKAIDFDKFKTVEEFEKAHVESYNEAERVLQSHLECEPKYVETYDEFLNAENALRGKNGLLAHKSHIIDFSNNEVFKDYMPLLCKYYYTDGTYDLTEDWDFS